MLFKVKKSILLGQAFILLILLKNRNFWQAGNQKPNIFLRWPFYLMSIYNQQRNSSIIVAFITGHEKDRADRKQLEARVYSDSKTTQADVGLIST